MKFQRGKKTVTTAGTRVALATTVRITTIIIKARDGNTGKVFPGDSTVDNADTEQGLNPGERLTMSWPYGEFGNPADIYIDAATSGDGVVFWYLGG